MWIFPPTSTPGISAASGGPAIGESSAAIGSLSGTSISTSETGTSILASSGGIVFTTETEATKKDSPAPASSGTSATSKTTSDGTVSTETPATSGTEASKTASAPAPAATATKAVPDWVKPAGIIALLLLAIFAGYKLWFTGKAAA